MINRNFKNLILGLEFCAIVIAQSMWAGTLQDYWDSASAYVKKILFISYFIGSKNNTHEEEQLVQSHTTLASESQESTLPTPSDIAHRLKSALQQTSSPDHFLLGASISEHQCSPNCTPDICSWARFAQEKNLYQYDETSSMNMWKYYRAYIDYAKDELKLNALRFSVEWPLVQPNGPESFDEKALQHYADQFVYAIKKGITPVVCFHHYTDPCWFLDQGGFEEKENIQYFVNFCNKIYRECICTLAQDREALQALQTMNPRQPLFATFNSPEGYAFKGYREMVSPPANPKKKGLKWVMKVLINMIDAHTEVYHQLKDTFAQLELPHINEPQIGFLKNIHQLDPARSTIVQKCFAPLSKLICATGNKLQNECFFQLFTTGKCKVTIPFKLDVPHKNKKTKNALDFIGINYYSNREMFLHKRLHEKKKELKTNSSNYRIYPHGLYRAIAEISERMAQPLGIPMYVTENGIATNNTSKRYKFYQAYLNELTKAVEDGHNVRGYLPWTLANNYEWPSLKNTNRRQYGLCMVHEKHPKQLVAKNGSRSYFDFVDAFQEKLD